MAAGPGSRSQVILEVGQDARRSELQCLSEPSLSPVEQRLCDGSLALQEERGKAQWKANYKWMYNNPKPKTPKPLNPKPLNPETLYTRMNRELQAKLEEERKQDQERVSAFEPGGDLEKFFQGRGFRVEGLGV